MFARRAEKIFHYNFSISNIGEDWEEGKKEGEGGFRRGKGGRMKEDWFDR